ncbi:MAG TPA: YicC family protein [Ignavibacteriaceae bacterium]|nr:YicC family protein [Ignavibacteriaceae bacterium]
MIFSMTGFGKASNSFNGFNMEIEVKSFNNRYLELSLKLPTSLQSREYEIKEYVKSKIKRGKVYINISIKPEGDANSFLFLSETKLKESVDTLKKIRKALKIKDKIKIEHVLTFKDLFSPELGEFEDEHFEALKSTLDKSLENVVSMRKAEGEQLSKDLRQRLDKIEEHLIKIENIYRTGVDEQFAKLKQRLSQLIEDISVYNERLDVELALLAEKADITEECVRLRSHLKFFKENLENGDETGRKLNFLCQEMHREANTIASKSLSTEVIHHSVFIREEIEKIREQIQNVE